MAVGDGGKEEEETKLGEIQNSKESRKFRVDFCNY